MTLPNNIPAIDGLDDITKARAVLYQGGRLVHAPYGTGLLPLTGGTLTGSLSGTGGKIENAWIDGTANAGPFWSLFRDSDSPAANDGLGGFVWWGRDSAANKTGYAQLSAVLADPVDGSEDATIEAYIQRAGALTKVVDVSAAGLRSFFPLDLSSAGAGQIAFPAAQNASAGANVLDDYEEGNFTPTVAFGGAAVGVTYSAQTGRYVKIGRAVLFQLRIALTSKGTSVGSMTIEGLPFTADANTYAVAMRPNSGGWATLVAGLAGEVTASTTSIAMTAPNTTGASGISNTNATNASAVNVAGVYFT
jgi:hypothetical protein